MEETKLMWIVGGDGRMAFAGHRLEALSGWRVLSPSAATSYQALLLPGPASRDGVHVSGTETPLDALLAQGRPGALVLGGMLSPDWIARIYAAGQTPVDYLQYEPLVLQNAIATAEGAMGLAMERLDTTLAGTHAVVVGAGRIALALAPRLRAMGCDAVVCARSPAGRARARLLGCPAAPLAQLADWCQGATLLINTVPAPVVGADAIAALDAHGLVIDLASAPGGVDQNAARERKIDTVWALSLPPKMRQGHMGNMGETEKTRKNRRHKLCKL